MKRTLVSLLMILTMSVSVWADEVDTFLDKFENFVTSVQDMDSDELIDETLKKTEKQYEDFTKQYSRTIKKKMTSKEIEKYNKLRAKYKKKILGAKAKRKGASVKGWVKGMLGQDDDE